MSENGGSQEVVCFAPKYNVKRADATGAFQPEARRFLDHHGYSQDSLHIFDNKATKPKMRREILDVLSGYTELDGVFMFMHGYKSGIQCGFRNCDVHVLAKAISESCDCIGAPDWVTPIVGLYACDTGRDLDKDRRDDLEQFGGDGGFADLLRDELCRQGAYFCRVDAHVTAGHTSKNPNVRRFFGDGSHTGGIGGYYPIPFRSKLWKKWRLALKTPFRYDFPFMTAAEITNHLEKWAP